MSCSVVIVPIVISSWPTILPAITAAAAAMGFSAARREQKTAAQTHAGASATVDVKNANVVGEELGAGQRFIVHKDDVSIEFTTDARGRCKITVHGEGRPKWELEAIGKEAANRVVQMYTYNKVMTELKQRDFDVVEEEVDEQGAIRLKLRRQT